VSRIIVAAEQNRFLLIGAVVHRVNFFVRAKAAQRFHDIPADAFPVCAASFFPDRNLTV